MGSYFSIPSDCDKIHILMLTSWFSPLAPAAVLLLGAFLLSIVFPRLPDRWRSQRFVGRFGASSLVGLAVLALLGTRLAIHTDTLGEELELLSGWNFSTIESVATLAVRADVVSLSFMLLTLLILMALTIANSGDQTKTGKGASWLALGAGACLLFVSANGLTIGYAVLFFDFVAMVYWLRRGQTGLGVAQLFLGVFTTSGLVLASLNASVGNILFGMALWLRLGLYPLSETINRTRLRDYGYLVYLAFSLTVGLYLAIRVWVGPLPEILLWLIVLTMLLGGSLTWLTDDRFTRLIGLVIVEASLMLLPESLDEGAAVAYVLGLILSLVALWVTPPWGKPELAERGWPWPYLPAAGATLTLLGVPFSLSWPARASIYQSLFGSEQIIFIGLILLAEGLALSGLVQYWLLVWQGQDENGVQAVAGTVIMVPFLIPVLAPFILSALTQTELPSVDLKLSSPIFIASIIVAGLAIGGGYFKPQIMSRLKLSSESFTEFAGLLTLAWRWGATSLDWLAKLSLRVEVLLQGQHYMGWALFTALVGVVVILLGT